MSDESDLDIFEAEEEFAPSRGSNPRLLQVIGALVVAGLLVGVVASVIVSGIASVSPQRVEPGSVVCGGAAICDDLSLDQLRSLTGIDFADDAVVTASQYAETDSKITVTATVVLGEAAANPFDDSAYLTVSTPQLDWPIDALTLIDYYAASGENGSLYGEAVLAIDDRVRDVVLVEVVRTL
jgi:hypothetical protein